MKKGTGEAGEGVVSAASFNPVGVSFSNCLVQSKAGSYRKRKGRCYSSKGRLYEKVNMGQGKHLTSHGNDEPMLEN